MYNKIMLHESFHSTESQEKTPLEYRRDETDFDVINAVELNETIESPETAGLNLTTDQIINAGRLKEVAAAQKMIEDAGGDEDAVFRDVADGEDGLERPTGSRHHKDSRAGPDRVGRHDARHGRT